MIRWSISDALLLVNLQVSVIGLRAMMVFLSFDMPYFFQKIACVQYNEVIETNRPNKFSKGPNPSIKLVENICHIMRDCGYWLRMIYKSNQYLDFITSKYKCSKEYVAKFENEDIVSSGYFQMSDTFFFLKDRLRVLITYISGESTICWNISTIFHHRVVP